MSDLNAYSGRPCSAARENAETVADMRTEWTPEQVSATEPAHFAVVEGPRRSLIGEPCNAACECGWRGTCYSFGDERNGRLAQTA